MKNSLEKILTVGGLTLGGLTFGAVAEGCKGRSAENVDGVMCVEGVMANYADEVYGGLQITEYDGSEPSAVGNGTDSFVTDDYVLTGDDAENKDDLSSTLREEVVVAFVVGDNENYYAETDVGFASDEIKEANPSADFSAWMSLNVDLSDRINSPAGITGRFVFMPPTCDAVIASPSGEMPSYITVRTVDGKVVATRN
ncbi:MAG: hypothetical protein WC897_05165 [Candidatus Gracilibacteria bacterium]